MIHMYILHIHNLLWTSFTERYFGLLASPQLYQDRINNQKLYVFNVHNVMIDISYDRTPELEKGRKEVVSIVRTG